MAGAVRGGRATAGYARGGGTAGYARGGRFARSGGGYYGGGPVYGGPIYDSCDGYGYGYGNSGCPGYGVPLVGGVIQLRSSVATATKEFEQTRMPRRSACRLAA